MSKDTRRFALEANSILAKHDALPSRIYRENTMDGPTWVLELGPDEPDEVLLRAISAVKRAARERAWPAGAVTLRIGRTMDARAPDPTVPGSPGERVTRLG